MFFTSISTLSPQCAVGALFVRCWCAVRALFVRCGPFLLLSAPPVSNRYSHHLAQVAPPSWLFRPRGGVLRRLHPSGGMCSRQSTPPLLGEGGAPGRLTSEIQISFDFSFKIFDFALFKFTCVPNPATVFTKSNAACMSFPSR